MEIAEMLKNENALFILRSPDLAEFAKLARQLPSDQPKQVNKICEAEKPFSQSEAVQFLGKSRQTLIAWRKKGIIQAYRLGGRIYYKPSELVAALEKLV